jgi:hypothetical protein
MQKLNHNSDRVSILNAAQCGVEFEFYSNYGLEDTQSQLSELLGRKIRLETKAHSEFQPSAEEFKMEPDMSGGKGLVELVTGALPLRNARIMILKMLQWIRTNGYTNDRASIHINLSFNPDYLEDPLMISKMNVLKFILDFNERQVYKFFPNREKSTYAKSIKWVMPKDEAIHFDGKTVATQSFKFADTKYYGINFSKKEKNYLEFRYLGGKDYEHKQDDILYLMEMFLMQMWNSCNNPVYTEENKIELRNILNRNAPVIETLRDFKQLNHHWPKIHLLVDLQEHEQVIKVQWHRIKNRVMNLIMNGGMTEGIINYDSDFGVIQVRDGKFGSCYFLENVEFYNCEVGGNVERSDFYNCTVKGANMIRCNFYDGTEIIESKIESSYVHGSCEVRNCYVFGRDGIFKGRMIGGIYREGRVGPHARFEDTEVVTSVKIK